MALLTLSVVLFSLHISTFARKLNSRGMAVSNNCSAESIPCGGPDPLCCESGLFCNFRRGIPVCENAADSVISGFNHMPCTDPYLANCDFTGIMGFCCPIGTLCYSDGKDRSVECIDAHGTTASSFPSATTGVLPSATPISGNDPSIEYLPSNAWSVSSSNATCSSGLVHTTDILNATISYNYIGTSIDIHVVTSSNGGVFSVIVDGFNTTSTVDTYSGVGQPFPLCYPLRFPPFAITPPDFASRNDHNISLVFIGSSVSSTNTDRSVVQFDSFGIPDFSRSTLTNDAVMSSIGHINGLLVVSLILYLVIS